jgi:hypothetical protein
MCLIERTMERLVPSRAAVLACVGRALRQGSRDGRLKGGH